MKELGLLLVLAALAGACSASIPSLDASLGDAQDAAVTTDALVPVGDAAPGVFAARVVSFEPGPNAGFGQGRMPGVVLGPPQGAGDSMGGTDVVSLGQGGRICLELGPGGAIDGPGVDLLVFENAFLPAGSRVPYAELAAVSVSDDGVDYREFACDPTQPYPWTGCAGWNPVYSSPSNGLSPTDPRLAGGDPFDLATVGLARARFVCVRDLDTQHAGPPSAGFDLDAIAAVHPGPP